jgi:ribosome-associated protein
MLALRVGWLLTLHARRSANAYARFTTCQDQGVQEIEIRGDMIRLGQLLKLADLAGSGADARDLLLESAVTVNGDIEVRRGRQLHRGDVVAIGDHTVRVG